MIKVVLAEDHVIVRKAIKSLLEGESDISVIGEADNGEQVLKMISNKMAMDIIITENYLPDINGIHLITQLKELLPTCKIAVLSMVSTEKDILRAFKAGADGYLNKGINVNELLFAMRHICEGGTYICSISAMALIRKIQQLPEVTPVEINPDLEFSAREIEILSLMAEGYTNHEISERLFTSKRTVESHRQNMINKTGSRNTAALIKYAIQHEIIR